MGSSCSSLIIITDPAIEVHPQSDLWNSYNGILLFYHTTYIGTSEYTPTGKIYKNRRFISGAS